MDELKPCPFCGKQPICTGEQWGHYAIECCDIHVQRDTQAGTAAAWNRRTPPPQAAQAIAELSDHIGSYVKGEALTQGGIDRLIESAQRAIALCKQLAAHEQAIWEQAREQAAMTAQRLEDTQYGYRGRDLAIWIRARSWCAAAIRGMSRE